MSTFSEPPTHDIRAAVARALAEDLTPLGDLTSALLSDAVTATAEFVPRRDGILAGSACAREAYAQVDDRVDVEWTATDGDTLAARQAFCRVYGPLRSILTAERTALNFLTHLSGIATLTRSFVDAAAAAGGQARIWDTRKTTPGLRALEKAAVRAGGGANHRGNLSEWILLKDNHLAGLGITDAVARARRQWPGRTVEVECDRSAQVEEALSAGADIVLLDNMSPEQVRDCVALISRVAGPPEKRRLLVEVSGGITLETVGAYATSGVDLISVGALTTSAPALDIGLDVKVE